MRICNATNDAILQETGEIWRRYSTIIQMLKGHRDVTNSHGAAALAEAEPEPA